MEWLGASKVVLEIYKPLLREHLKLSGDITQPNRFGQCTDKLAWFWNAGQSNADGRYGWMDECAL